MQEETKNCQNCKKDFVIEPDDFGFYEKMGVPAPEICPQCRQQTRMLFRNFKTLYKRPCSKSGEMIISMYNPEVLFPVFNNDTWWGDTWDPIDYGRQINLSGSFFEQLKSLLGSVP